MPKLTALIFVIALRLIFHPASASQDPPFSSHPSLQPFAISQINSAAKFISFNGNLNGKKIELTWAVEENETASRFEVEKSIDGYNFSLAALVFGTDKPATCKYEFYEKAGNQETFYRIKLVNKDTKVIYSSLILLNPKS